MRTLALILAMVLLPAAAAGQQSDGVPSPRITRGKGANCIADTAYMRRFHMRELVHQRDATVREGRRGQDFSLRECVACHASTGGDGQPVPVNAPGEFCAGCHEYAAVRIDCFQCHATRPEPDRQAAGQAAPFPMTASAAPGDMR